MNTHEFEANTWHVVSSFFDQTRGDAIVKHALDSFNDFIHRKLDQIIDGFNPIVIHHKHIPDKDMYEYQMSIHINNPVITKPMINEKDGSTRAMTPNDARQRNFTYSSTLYVDVHIDTTMVKDDQLVRDTKTIKKVNIGKIPIMLHSNYCVLKEPGFNNSMDECRYDYGGYFNVNGNEKVVVSQDRISENKTFVFLDTKLSTYSHISEIRSVPDNTFGPPKLTSIKLSSKTNQHGKYMKATIHHVRHDIPVFILFRALGLCSDKEIVQFIVYDIDTPLGKLMINELKGSIDDASGIVTPLQALEYLSKHLNITGYPKEYLYNKDHRINIVRDILKKEFLPHVGEDYAKKALYLGYMVHKLVRCYLGHIPLDDRDSYINKRVDTPGILMANLFRQYYGKLVRDMKSMIYREIGSGPWKATNEFIDVVNTNNIYKILKSTTIESGLKYSLATGNWGLRNNSNKTKQGVAQVLNRLTYNATLSHLRRINTPMEKTGKLVQPRKLHNTQYGIICPAETPEGSSVGLVKNLTMMTTVTVASDASMIKELVRDNGTVLFDGANLVMFARHTHVFINGDLVGTHPDPARLYTVMKEAKRRGQINIYTGVVWNVRGNYISLCTDAGRCVRPLYIVEEGNRLCLGEGHVHGLLDKKMSWNDLLSPFASPAELAEKYGNTKPVIEYLDVEEMNAAMIAMRCKDLAKTRVGNTLPPRYTHLEIHPSLMFGILASNIPFPDHNQAPRNCYQCLWEGEPVLMADRSIKPIKNVRVGDEVVTFDPTTLALSTTKVVHQYVRATDKKIYKVTLVNNQSIVATEDHKFMTDQGWVEVRDLSTKTRMGVLVADVIRFVTILSIVPVVNCMIADITVESENHTFIAGHGGFASHNSAMGKQAIGLYATNFRSRMDTLGNVLNYPQKPMVDTKVGKYLHGSEMPSGINAIVAIATYTGYNQEDSVIMNKSSIDRGLFTSTFYRSYKEHCIKNHSTGEEEVFVKPDADNTKGMKPFNYDKLEEDGFVKENTYVEMGDVLIGKTMPQKVNDTFIHKDNSVVVKNNEMGYVDRNCAHDRYFKNVNSDGYAFCKTRVRNFRSPVIGDKFACYSPDHDVLTGTRGWVPIAELTLDDTVASMVDDALVYQRPVELQAYDYKGPMYLLESNQVSLCVTPNHRMWVRNKDPKAKFGVRTAEEVHHKRLKYKKNVDVWTPDLTNAPENFIIRDGKITHFCMDDYVDGYGNAQPGQIIDIDSWLTLYGIYVAEGSVVPYGISYAANKPRVKAALNAVSEKTGLTITPHLTHGEYDNYYWGCTSASRFIGEGHIAITKRLMDWVWYLDRDQCQQLIHAMCLGDGGLNMNKNSRTDTWRYYTASTGLADDFMRLCLHAGYSANKLLKSEAGTSHTGPIGNKQTTITQNADYFNLSIIKTQNEPVVNKELGKKPFWDDWMDYDGKVHCCTVPLGHGIIYVRRQGYGVWSSNSRSAQKGTCGMLYDQADMPFSLNGITPDIIMNPHAIPSRMTMAQLMECLMSKAAVEIGAYGDATPFTDLSVEDIAQILQDCGMERYGNEILHNPRTGEQMPTLIFMGPTYYQRLKHMVADKIHGRSSSGPVVLMTRQPAEGRAREGGLRMGEMEVECNWGHGMLHFLKERLMDCSDNYRVFLCSKCGMMSNVNPDKNIYDCKVCKNKTAFVQVRIPYAAKLLFHEVQCMGIGTKMLTGEYPGVGCRAPVSTGH